MQKGKQQMSSKKSLSLATKRSLHGYVFIMPFFLGFLFLVLSPFLLYIVIGFNKVSAGTSGINLEYVGLKNFTDVLFEEPDFLQNLLTSLQQLFVQGTFVIIFSFFIAVILNQQFPGRSFARAIFFLPVIVASGAAALSQNDALSISAITVISDTGSDSSFSLLQGLMNLFGGVSSDLLFGIVTELTENFYNIVISSGVQILIFLAGLQGISPSLYEAAYMDGATAWESFWKITFPMISPLILVNAVYTVVDFMGNSSNAMINTMYEYSMGRGKYGISSAMGIFYFGLVFVILGLIFAIVSKFVVYDDK